MDTNESITKEKLWSNRIRDFRESGLTRKEWCCQNQIPLSTLSYWIRKLDPARSESGEQQEPVFARLPSENELFKASCNHAPVRIRKNPGFVPPQKPSLHCRFYIAKYAG